MKRTPKMHTVTEQDWFDHCAIIADVLVRRSDARPNQRTMTLTLLQVDALIYDSAYRKAYWETRQ